MGLIISGTTNTISNLSADHNPITVSASAYLNNSAGGVFGGSAAIYGAAGTTWTVTNFGLIVGKDVGITFGSGGMIDNRAPGAISGGSYGVVFGAGTAVSSSSPGGTLTNAGVVAGGGSVGAGVKLVAGGTVVNLSAGTISGPIYGINAFSNPTTVTNAGAIRGIYGYGVNLRGGGSVTNLSGGTISGNAAVDSPSATVTNAGLLKGNFDGLDLLGGGIVSNQSTGTISAQIAGIFFRNGAGTVTNAGLVTATGAYGVRSSAGGSITNLSSGTINALVDGISVAKGGATIFNAGSIGGKSAIVLHSGYTHRVIAAPGAVFSGTVNGGNSIFSSSYVSTLELATGATPGLISGLGAQFTAFARTTIDAGAAWTLTGANTLTAGSTLSNAGALSLLNGSLTDAGTVLNNGLLQVNAATLTVATLGGTGQVSIGGGGTLNVTGSLATTETIALGAGGVLQIKSALTNAGTIAGGFGNGVQLSAGGNVTNLGIGGISGYYGININGGAGTVANAGNIAGNIQYGYGIYLRAGGGVTNQNTGTIGGGRGGIAISGGTGTVGNAGLLTNPGNVISGYAIYLHAGGGVSNASTGTIGGNHIGVEVNGGTGTLTNAGAVNGANKAGVNFKAGGTVTNLGGGSISGRYGGIYIAGTSGAVTNAGTIASPSNAGINLFNGGSVSNQSGGTVIGVNFGVEIGLAAGSGTVTNAGNILGTGYYGHGIALDAGGAVTNQTGGTIGAGSDAIIVAAGAGTVANAGVINGGTEAVSLAAGFANRVIVDPGAVFGGIVNGGNTIGATATSTLELASGASVGLISGLGSQFINLAQTTVAAGALWTMTGANTLLAGTTLANSGELTVQHGSLSDAGAVVNNGAIQLDGAVLTVGTLSGNGHLVIGGGSSLAVDGQILATQTIAFNGSGQLTLRSTVAAQFAGQFVVNSGATLSSQAITDSVSGTATNVTVNGTAAVWNSAGELLIGDTTRGSFGILAGATATAGNGAIIGLNASASGSAMDVSGLGSHLQVTGSLDVGVAASGALALSDGATVVADALEAGNSAAAVGQISLNGAGTRLTVAGDAIVADDGTGVLSVLSGATFSGASLTIGNTGNSSGALVVSGSGSVINLTGALNIGTALGTGDLTVGPGAAVHASVVNLQGQVVLEGGLLDPTVNLINQGQTAGGFGTIAANFIVDEGVIQAGGTKPSQRLLIVQGTVLGGGTLSKNNAPQPSVAAGVLQINAGGTMELTGAVLNAASTTFQDNLTPAGTYSVSNSVIDVTFADGAGVLLLDDIAGFGGTVAASRTGDSFVVTGGTLSNLSVSKGDTLTFSDSGPNAGAGGIDSIIFGAPVNAANFVIVNNNTVQVACFAAGTRIETAAGPVPVEGLSVGDLALNQRGEMKEIVWIGTRTIDCRRHPRPELVWPVRVSAGAFGENVPKRDLYLSPDHAVLVNDVLVPVKLLVNGASIAQAERDDIVYFHVELPRHDVILAEGLAVESYLDLGCRADFRQAGTIRLFADFSVRPATSAATAWETDGAAPLVLSGPSLAAARVTFR